jgi:RND family efflux transporter MFP subunit
LWLGGFAAGVIGIVAAGWYLSSRPGLVSSALDTSAPAADPVGQSPGVVVDVVAPRPGGIERVCDQPGTVEPFESADLYAKVSGFLAEQTVDIGSRVKRGQVLARISLPEFEKQVVRDAAKVQDARARVRQAAAKVDSARADARAAQAQVAFAEADVKSKAAYRKFRKKQLDRITELNNQQAIDARVVDEKEDQYEAAFGAELAAKERVTAVKSQADAADAKIAQAEADRDVAEAEVGVASAELEKTKVWLDYAVITSPYDGVITRRSFSRGGFVRAAEAGAANTPLLSVDRTDLMRVVIQVPDRDVPYASVGDPATVTIDALPEKTFSGTVARFAQAEDSSTRLMRTEVDVPNPGGRLRRGMYGRATIVLEPGTPTAFRIPSTALADRGEGDKASVRVVREGKVHLVPVTLGADNGLEVEVIRGLSPADQVVVRSSAPALEGTDVQVNVVRDPHAPAGH